MARKDRSGAAGRSRHAARSPPLAGMVAGPALVLLALAAFAPALRNGFVNWDDGPYIVINRTLDDADDGLGRIWLEPRSTPIYYPLVFTTFWIERQLDVHRYEEEHAWQRTGINWDHAINMLLHGLAGLLLWQCLLRLKLPAGAAWAAAAIWVVHPMQVESVVWAVERKNTLAALFYFAAALMWLRADGRMRRPSYFGALAMFACMMLSKTAFVGLALTLPLLEWLRGRRIGRGVMVATLPFVVLALPMLWLWDSMGGELLTVDPPPPAARLMIAGQAIWFYLYKLVWPVGLTTIYPRWDTTVNALRMLPLMAAAVAAIAWFAGAVATARGRSLAAAALLVGVFQYVVTVGPALGLVPWPHTDISFVANHFTYVGLAGPIALIVLGARKLWRRLADRASGPGTAEADAVSVPQRLSAAMAPHPIPAAIVAVLIVALGTTSYLRSRQWYDAPTLANAVLAVNPGCPEALALLSMVERSKGNHDEAIALMARVLQRKPKYPQALMEYARMLDQHQSRIEEAIEHAKRAAELQPDVVTPYWLTAELLEKAGRYAEAAEWAGRTLQFTEVWNRTADGRLAPPGEVLALRARCLGRLGQFEQALAEARKMPSSVQREQLIAATLIEMGRAAEAVQVLSALIQRFGPSPERPEARRLAARAHLSRARAFGALERPDQADADLRRAVELDGRLEGEADRIRQGSSP